MLSIKGSVIHTGNDVIRDAFVNLDGTTIANVSHVAAGEVRGEYAVITPAFIDPHCHTGMVRAGEPISEGETNEHSDSVLAIADVLDSIQMDDRAFRESVEAGVLYSCVLPGSGNILSGQSAVIRNYGKTTSDALIRRAGIKAAVGYNPMSVTAWKGKRPSTRMGAMSVIREKFYSVKNKIEQQETDKEPKASNRLTREEEILRDILHGKERLRVHAHKADDIAAILRFADEFARIRPEFAMSFDIEHACDVYDRQVFEMLKNRGIRVVYGPVDSVGYKVELKHKDWKNIEALLASGVEFGLMSDHPVSIQRMLLLQLRWFLRAGIDKADAIRIITRNNAEILGIDNILGSLETGKWASFVCWNGDPFDLGSYPVAVYGEGETLYSASSESPPDRSPKQVS